MNVDERRRQEEIRYASVQVDMQRQLDAAVLEHNPMTGIARAMLYATLYERNEATHRRVLQELAEGNE